MTCETCASCMSFKIENGQYKINCAENGTFPVSETFGERFSCKDWQKREAPEEPPKDNVLIILKGSGRDFMVHDDNITCEMDIVRRLKGKYEDENIMVQFGSLMFCKTEIAVISYIGD